MSLNDEFYYKSIFSKNYSTPTGRKRFVNVVHNRYRKTYEVQKIIISNKKPYDKLVIVGVYKNKDNALKKAKSIMKK